MAKTSSKILNPRKRPSLDMLPLRLQHPVPEAAVLLGWGERSVWRAIRSGRLPAVHLGARIFVARTELEKFIADNADRSGALVRAVPPHIKARVDAAAARAVNA